MIDKDGKKYIELNSFLKFKGLAMTGGQAKQFIQSEQIKVNNEIETRNKRKLYGGEIVSFEDQEVEVLESEIRE